MTKEEGLAQLRRLLKPGDTVYTVLRYVSGSGMTRRIDVFAIQDNKPIFLTPAAAAAVGYRWDYKKSGLVTNGCGMDMGFEVVYNTGQAIWHGGDGKYVSNRNGDRGPETDGGYMLR